MIKDIKSILLELEQLVEEEENKNSSSKILLPRQIEERKKKLIANINKKIQQYIENGSEEDLDLTGTPITSLPNNLKSIGRDLILYKCPIVSLPNDLTIGNNLDLGYTKINSIPNNLRIIGYLYLTNTPLIEKYSVGQITKMIEDKGGSVYYIIY